MYGNSGLLYWIQIQQKCTLIKLKILIPSIFLKIGSYFKIAMLNFMKTGKFSKTDKGL